jgi:hypothetical protein
MASHHLIRLLVVGLILRLTFHRDEVKVIVHLTLGASLVPAQRLLHHCRYLEGGRRASIPRLDADARSTYENVLEVQRYFGLEREQHLGAQISGGAA